MPRTERHEDAEPDGVVLISAPDDPPEEPSPEPPAEGGEAKKPAEEDPRERQLRELRRELRSSRKRISELEESERAWAERARAKAGKAEEEPPAKPADEEPDLDVIEALTSEGVKGLDKVLKKLGYARVEDVEAKIERTRAHLTRDAKLLGRYPDLGDEKSEFFQAAARRYGELAQNPALQESGMLMELAAELAEGDLKLGRGAAKAERRRSRAAEYEDEDLDEGEETEDERIERVRAQAGSRGRGAVRESADNELTPLQRKIAARIGVSEEAYRKRAKAGVQMSGLPRR
ncbi:MAG: hypothetical protein HXY24_10855 [Rubrivivax sp.]|nr:hypothetical protein [Rubrivivax sp.]